MRHCLLLACPDPRTPNRAGSRMTSPRRILSACLAALVFTSLAIALVPASAAGAATADDLDAARKQLAEARAGANETAALFSAADHELEQTREEIARLQDSISTTKAKVQELREYTRERAVFAYTHPGSSLEALVDATDAVDAARRQQLLDRANQTDNEIAKRLATLTSQLKSQQSDLERQETEQEQLSEQLDTKLAALRVNQQDVEQAVAGLQGRLDAEIQIAALIDAQRSAELEAEKAALQAPQTISSAGPGQIIPPPPAAAGPFQCPVQGAAYSDDFGGAGGHGGIDMFVPNGTAAVAVMAGTVRYVPNEGAGGNTAYLTGVDGNSYFYAHFSQFIGEARSVAQGEVIGLTGMTGNTSAPHLHFEIRLGGDNGTKTNPYPTLRASGC
jgi:murein DD-endopeptidase MepM/ murein hydrolase activator NlpD